MKFINLFVMLAFGLTAEAAKCPANFKPNSSIDEVKQIERYLKPRLAPKAVPARLLAPEIRRLAKAYNVPAMMLAKVMLVESRGIASLTSSTHDSGIMQVNRVHRVSNVCLQSWKCNLETGAKILSKTHRVCEYNVGHKWRAKITACEKYERKIAIL